MIVYEEQGSERRNQFIKKTSRSTVCRRIESSILWLAGLAQPREWKMAFTSKLSAKGSSYVYHFPLSASPNLLSRPLINVCAFDIVRNIFCENKFLSAALCYQSSS